jgi:hypothetical protein
LSDTTLATWLASDASVSSANKAIETFLELASNENYPTDVRIAVLRNAQLVENTKNGKSEQWKNFDRAYNMHKQVTFQFFFLSFFYVLNIPIYSTHQPLYHYSFIILGERTVRENDSRIY